MGVEYKIMKKNNKGITLIELIITLAIMAIAIQIIYSLFFVGNKSFNISKNKGFAQQEARIAFDLINTELRLAKEISDNNLSGKYYSLTIEDNKLYRESSNASGKVLFEFKGQAKIKYENITNGILYIKIIVEEGKDNNKRDYVIDSSILLENLESHNQIFNNEKIYYSKYE